MANNEKPQRHEWLTVRITEVQKRDFVEYADEEGGATAVLRRFIERYIRSRKKRIA